MIEKQFTCKILAVLELESINHTKYFIFKWPKKLWFYQHLPTIHLFFRIVYTTTPTGIAE